MSVMNRWLAGVLALVALAAAGCGGSGNGTEEPVTVEGGEYAYVIPDEIDGGVVSMRFRNTGQEPHEFALSRIDEGHTIEEMVQDLLADEDVPYATDIGGVPLLSPGEEITITRRLEPGTYGLLCFFPSPNGEPHVELGMSGELRAVGESSSTLPTADAVITATENGYSVPEIEAGTRTIELRNESGKETSWYLSVPQPGATTMDFEAWIEGGQEGEAPLSFVGAMQSFPSGESNFVTLDFEAGTTYRLEDDPDGLSAVEFTPR